MTAVWITLGLGVLVLAFIVVRFQRSEARKNDAFIEHLRRMGRECPACKPWGGWYLGKMNPDGSYQTHTCDVCHGTGELPEPSTESEA